MEAHGMPSGREGAQSSKAAAIEPRRLMWAVAEVCWADATGHLVRSRATIVDISASGACIRLKNQIGVGSRLTIKWNREQFAAIARNCRSDGQDYLLGVRRDGASDPGPNSEKTSHGPNTAPAPSLPSSSTSAVASNQTASGSALSSLSSMPEPVVPEPVVPKATVPETAAPSKTTSVAMPGQRSEAIERKPERGLNSELGGAAPRREAAGQERKAMSPKGFLPKFWHCQHEADAPAQVALKETPVNKPTTHAVEHVSDPPSHLLSYEDIYHAAGIMNPRSGYGIRKVVDMLNSERIRDLAKEVQRASVLMALDAAGASVDDLLQDATRRQQALNSYEDGQRKQLEEFEARKAAEDAQIEAEVQRITAHYAERMQQNKEEVTKHKEALHNWQMAKQHESQRIGEVIELCGKPAPAPPAATTAMAAAATK
jgi:hypothetical protein